VEDALRMNAPAFEAHHIKVIRDYTPDLPRINVDRHSLLQILINLLRNAKHALDAGSPAEKKIVVTIGIGAECGIVVRIKDNGVGIARENLTRIFQHGFTTKANGHGFGLHSGANAAREMGGHLNASSEGLGQGAEFTLELPVTKPNAALAA
jgi:two-component system, NtrC family, sensor kinase